MFCVAAHMKSYHGLDFTNKIRTTFTFEITIFLSNVMALIF